MDRGVANITELQKQYQEAEMRLIELQNKYRVAKKNSCPYKLWADGRNDIYSKNGNSVWLVSRTFYW